MLALVFVVGVALRVWRVPDVPGGLNQDEAGAAYEAWSLLHTARDKWGNFLPVYFPAWGSGQNVLYSYLLVPVLAVFDLSVAAIRAPAVVLGILALPLFHATLRESQPRSTALLGTLLLAVMPWHVIASRWALESNVLPFFLLPGAYATARAARSPRWIPFALAPWAIALYAYLIAAPVVALLVAATAWRMRAILREHPLRAIAALALFGAHALPAATFLAKNTLGLPTAAIESVLPVTVPLLPAQRLSQIAEPLADRLAGNVRLFASGFDDRLPWNRAGVAPLAVVAPWLVAIGVVVALARRMRGRPDEFLAWFAACLPLFAIAPLNANRANAILLPSIALAAIGARAVLRRVRPRVARRAIVLAAAVGLVAVVGRFANEYFRLPKRASEGFFVGLEDAYRRARTLAGEAPLAMSPAIPLPYLYALVFDRVPPERFQAEHEFGVGADGIYFVRRVGDTWFDERELPLEPGAPWYALVPASEAADAPVVASSADVPGGEPEGARSDVGLVERVGDWAIVRRRR